MGGNGRRGLQVGAGEKGDDVMVVLVEEGGDGALENEGEIQ